MADSEKLNFLFKTRKTAIQRLIDNGYDIPKSEVSPDDFKKLFYKGLHHLYFPDIIINSEDEKEKGLLVYFEPNIKFDKKTFLSRLAYVTQQYNNPAKIFFATETINLTNKPKANMFVKNELEKHPHVTIWKDLYPFSITKNILFPTCKKLSKLEMNTFLDYSRIKKENLKKVEKEDPLSIQYGLEIGDVIKIIRKNGDIDYRLVVMKGTT